MKVPAPSDATRADTAALVMTSEPVVVGPDDTLDSAAERMARYDIRHLPVVNDAGEVVGMLSDRDLRLAATELSMVRVRAAMTPSTFVVDPDTPVEEVASLLAEERIGAVPVVKEGKLIGIISFVDLLYAWEHDGEGIVRLMLADSDARFLLAHLRRHLAEVEDELVHTDHRPLQRDLASDAERLRRIVNDLERLLARRPPRE